MFCSVLLICFCFILELSVQDQRSVELADLLFHKLFRNIYLVVLGKIDFVDWNLLSMRYTSDAFGDLLDFHLDDRILEILTLLIDLCLKSSHGIWLLVNYNLFLQLIEVEVELLLGLCVNFLQIV